MAHYILDFDKIYFAVGLLEDCGSEWYQTINFYCNEDAATQAAKPFDPNSPCVTCSHFRRALWESFVGSLTIEKAVSVWEALCHQSGKIDQYQDQISQIVWSTG